MQRRLAVAVLFAAFSAAIPARAETVLAHDVFFTLKDGSKEARARLVAACKKYLAGQDGTVHFSVGTRGEEFARDVNDRGFDVALHILFKDRAAHDKYQQDPRHLRFIEAERDTWKQVRVFDSWVERAP
jgi:quinol monooxygenase YgiN